MSDESICPVVFHGLPMLEKTGPPRNRWQLLLLHPRLQLQRPCLRRVAPRMPNVQFCKHAERLLLSHCSERQSAQLIKYTRPEALHSYAYQEHLLPMPMQCRHVLQQERAGRSQRPVCRMIEKIAKHAGGVNDIF